MLLLPIVNAIIDYIIISKGLKVNHTLEAIVRGVIIGIISLTTETPLISFLLGCSVFWLIFEMVLNTLRKKPLLYVGYTAFSDKLIRRIFPKPEIPLLTIKLCLIALFGLV